MNTSSFFTFLGIIFISSWVLLGGFTNFLDNLPRIGFLIIGSVVGVGLLVAPILIEWRKSLNHISK